MRRLLATCAVLALSLACVGVLGAHVKDLSFATVKSQPQQRIVLFYFGSDSAARPIIDMVEATAECLLSLNQPQLTEFEYAKVDCESTVNKGECDEAGFKSTAAGGAGLWIFTSTPSEGIQAYSGTRDTPSLSTHIRHKFLPADASNVSPFVDEFDLFDRLDKSEHDPPKAIIVKFWEEWCTHCKSLKKPYDQAATYYRDQVQFMEVECSKNDKTKAFCQSNDVKSYPTLILFDGENKHTWDLPDKSITSFQNFFLAKLPAEQYTRVEDQDAAKLPPPPGTKAPAKAATKAAAKDEPAPASTKMKDPQPASSSNSKKKAISEEELSKKSTKKSRRDDEEEAPRRRRRSRRSRRRYDDDDEPRRRSRRRSRRSRRRSYDDDDDDIDDEPPRRRERRSSRRSSRSRRRYDDEEDDEPRRRKTQKKDAKQKDSKQEATDDLPRRDEL